MAIRQNYGIKYPFSNENLDNVYIDLNDNYNDGIKSRVLHVLFTPKGQKLRDPEFGTDLIKYLFDPSDDESFDAIKNSIKSDISKYVKEITFSDISINDDEENPNGKIIIIHYIINATSELKSVAVKI